MAVSHSKRRLIAVDCDGTFFDSNGYPSSRTRTVVQRLIDAGHHIVAATGRSQLTACDRLANVPGMRYIVSSNGAYCWDMQANQLVWEAPIAQTQVTNIVSLIRSGMPDATFGWETRSGIGFEDAFVELAGGINELETGGQSGDPWSQSLYKLKVRRPGVFRIELQSEVAALLGDGLCEISTSGAPFVEITAPGSHKGSGLEKIATMLELTSADTIVFGDNHNDTAMFHWAGHAVAMGNSLDAVKAVAHAVTLRNTEHGVAHYLERLLDAGEL